mmetsp:Transcript_2731/g.4686  ORF Transcript_2731/g.4686 Transcript_2731/m.4686 type:complete len:96 (+) Transcript_2731:1539-1826(+)
MHYHFTYLHNLHSRYNSSDIFLLTFRAWLFYDDQSGVVFISGTQLWIFMIPSQMLVRLNGRTTSTTGDANTVLAGISRDMELLTNLSTNDASGYK